MVIIVIYMLGVKHGLHCAKHGSTLCEDDPWIALAVRRWSF